MNCANQVQAFNLTYVQVKYCQVLFFACQQKNWRINTSYNQFLGHSRNINTQTKGRKKKKVKWKKKIVSSFFARIIFNELPTLTYVLKVFYYVRANDCTKIHSLKNFLFFFCRRLSKRKWKIDLETHFSKLQSSITPISILIKKIITIFLALA